MAWNFVDKPKSGTETALDACDYFLDEVIELHQSLGKIKFSKLNSVFKNFFSIFADAREQVRMIKHRELRHAVTSGDDRTVRVLLEALGSERQIITNMAPAGTHTLLFL